jgi:hypothetical protein
MDQKLFWEELFAASVIMALIIALLTGAGLKEIPISKEIGLLAAVLMGLCAVFSYCASAVNTEIIKEYFLTAFSRINLLSHRYIPEFPNVAYKK